MPIRDVYLPNMLPISSLPPDKSRLSTNCQHKLLPCRSQPNNSCCRQSHGLQSAPRNPAPLDSSRHSRSNPITTQYNTAQSGLEISIPITCPSFPPSQSRTTKGTLQSYKMLVTYPCHPGYNLTTSGYIPVTSARTAEFFSLLNQTRRRDVAGIT